MTAAAACSKTPPKPKTPPTRRSCACTASWPGCRDARQAVFWIYRVATNYCLNELRNRKRRAAPADTLPEPAGALGLDPERPIADRDLARRLIESAPAKVRAVAWLYHVDGFQRDEVAAILGVSERTITTRLAAFASGARKYLRKSGL